MQRTNSSTGILEESQISDAQTKKQGTAGSQINEDHKPEPREVSDRGHPSIDQRTRAREARLTIHVLVDQSGHKRNNVVYHINCSKCNKFYVGQTGRKLCTRIKEHNAAVRRHDSLSLISIHEDQEGHKFNIKNVKILAYGYTKHGREFLEAWYSTADSIKRCIELDPIYASLHAKDQLLHRNTRGEPNIRCTNQEARNCWQSDQRRSQAGTQRARYHIKGDVTFMSVLLVSPYFVTWPVAHLREFEHKQCMVQTCANNWFSKP
ncbi:hypothetical protein CLF_105067 [Clonorchis sinensis]|uniref:GIY-YIG domain-containing protein n=1 Tax=Clonorchis sinensis TaxID=79923 RepID=G7YCX4_CLOSI|nr:hypothetical protein CLF_105067 [Clonorchis sinensis]